MLHPLWMWSDIDRHDSITLKCNFGLKAGIMVCLLYSPRYVNSRANTEEFCNTSNRKQSKRPPDESTPPGCFDVRASSSVMFQPHQRAASDLRRPLTACCLHRCAALSSPVTGKSIIHECYCFLQNRTAAGQKNPPVASILAISHYRPWSRILI